MVKRVLKGMFHLAMRAARHADSEVLRNVRYEELARQQQFALVSRGAESFVILTADKAVSRSVYITGEFEFSTFATVLRLLGVSQVGTLVDVGANIGTICIPAVARGLAASAFAIEPEPWNYRVLVANVHLNGLEERVRLWNVACGAHDDETLQFELSPDNGGDHRVRVIDAAGSYGESTRSTIAVRSRRLDDIVLSSLDPKKDLVWLDVQGFEGFVLEGALNARAAGVPMVLEFWPYGMKRSGAYPAVRKSLSEYRWLYNLSEDQPQAVAITGAVLDRLYSDLGEAGEHVDLLITR